MAFNLISGSQTPYSVVYEIVGTGSPEVLLWSQMSTDLSEGPLKDELRNLAATTFAPLNLGGTNPRVRIYFPVGHTAAEGVVVGNSIDIRWVTTGLSATLPEEDESNSSLLIEIRFEHSAKR